jgi:hypothetical protein
MEKINVMNKEELLKPRYKKINNYPESPLSEPVGTIYTLSNELAYDKYPIWYYKPYDAVLGTWNRSFEHYPHLFRKLQWWEERKPEDMPEWISSIGKNLFAKVTNVFLFDIPERCMALFPHLGESGEEHECFYENYLPSDIEEYTAYQSSSNQK